MEAAQNTFISSTFWTERIGPTAALKTLEVMENIKSWDVITSIGESVQKRWAYLASLHKVNIDITGIPSLSSFTFSSSNHQAYKTFLTQEMLKKGFLAGTLFYAFKASLREIS